MRPMELSFYFRFLNCQRGAGLSVTRAFLECELHQLGA